MDMTGRSKVAAWLVTGAISAAASIVGWAPVLAADSTAGATAAAQQVGNPANDTCLTCHGNPSFAAPGADGKLSALYVIKDKFGNSVHGKLLCTQCHTDITDVPQKTGDKHQSAVARAAWRLDIPNICGTCHTAERAQYATSVHGTAVLNNKNPAAAVCSDCHTTHAIANPTTDAAKLSITQNCGTCHAENLKTYTDTYHGKVNTLGYAYTAKCFDCHGNHNILKVNDPHSTVYPANRVKTCQKCHLNATAGFATFEPHGTPHDFARYPMIWLASKFLLLMVSAMLAFFWIHAALWFYREFKEHAQRKLQTYIKAAELSDAKFKGKYYERFPLVWRAAHLIFAVSLMVMVLTGMSVLYAETSWASAVMHWLGGPKVEAVIHRTFAVVFVTVFVIQLAYFVGYLIRNRGTFEWFGPNSLFPRAQDVRDMLAMFRWFFGLGPRPVFDRWTYWQKFDFWSIFSVVIIVIACGVMLWSPTVTAAFLPGWVFNVATIFHGEGALLAVLFLFTVHFFNNHFRPDKFPLEVVMFTGAMPLEQFKREHRVEYNRMVASGEIQKHLVDAPSQPMTVGATILGFTLLGIGLLLLAFVLSGIFGIGS
jgi:cytochrome b subunit of formate dehydrogenase/cytochrome c553